jgi:hypothetical protein
MNQKNYEAKNNTQIHSQYNPQHVSKKKISVKMEESKNNDGFFIKNPFKHAENAEPQFTLNSPPSHSLCEISSLN